MTRILLNEPVPMSPHLERLRLFPGRHLGEDEMDRLQAYADARLAQLLAGGQAGIVHGLEVDLATRPSADGARVLGDGCVVRPGLALAGNGRLVGLFHEARVTWRALVEGYLSQTREADASGVYYLAVTRYTGLVDADQGLDPCRRGELDPRRDTRLESLGGLGLRRLALSAEVLAAMTQAQIQNHVAAMHVDGTFLQRLGQAVPLALLAVSRLDPPPPGPDQFRWRVDWVSQSAGRYLAVRDGGYQVLLAQVQDAFREALTLAVATQQEPGEETQTLGERLAGLLRLDFLPAAGVLPSVLLEETDSPQPTLRWLPRHLGVDMVPVAEESVAELIERHLPRRVIDLRRPAGDRLRLLLAVNEPDYRPDLLDFPQIDGVLVADLYRYHVRAYDAWRDWHQEFDRLYAVLGSEQLTVDALRALDLPRPLPEPLRPADFYGSLIAQAEGLLPLEQGRPPHPYDDGVPAAPDFYSAWLSIGADGTRVPPPLPAPTQDGLVVRYRVAQVEMEGVDSQIRTLRARVEKTRDYLLLQRQQLDAQTVSLAALGGGVAGDGAGLQVARWLPFTQLKMNAAATAAEQPLSIQASAFPGLSLESAPLSFQLPQAQPTMTLRSSPAGVLPGAQAQSRADQSSLPSLSLKGISAGSSLALARASAVEINLQRDRLDRLGAAPKQTVTKPAVQGRSYQFGVLDHIQAEVREYEAAYRGMRDLINTLDASFETAEAQTLRRTLEGFGTLVTPNALAAELRERPYPLGAGDLARVRALRDRLSGSANTATRTLVDGVLTRYSELLGALEIEEGALEEDAVADTKRRFEALFQAGQILTRQIAWMEDRYHRIEEELEGRLRERIRLEGVLDKLAAQIQEAQQRLAGLDGRRVERLGDYGLAQGLTREDWARVYREDQERSRILTRGLRGLYYVRVRETPIGNPLVEPLALRHGSIRDLVPGCDWQGDVEVPAVLAAFFDAVLEIPMADWRPLVPLIPRLPLERLPELLGLRRYRLAQHRNRTLGGSNAVQVPVSLAARLDPLAVATQGTLGLWFGLEPGAADTRGRYLDEVARILSLADLLGGSNGALRAEATALHDRLEQCVLCLMDRLAQVAPSLRFQWAQLAEDDRIDTGRPESWPGLERAEAEDFNALRTLAELVAWWFRQFEPEGSAAGRGALGNLIRAALIVAAHGDPQEILRGQVLVPPRRLAVGESLHLRLGQAPVAGTRLQILDDTQRVVGLVAVEDQDAQGVRAQVVRVDAAEVRVTTRFTVLGTRAMQRH